MRLAATQAAEYAFIFFASIALIAIYAGFAERLRLHRFFALPGLIFPSAVLLGAAAYKLGMHQFGGWDEGLLVHAATYYAQGFKPYVDFPCSMPPLFMAGVRCGIELLGLKWSSILLVSSAFTALTCLWIFALLRTVAAPRHWALAIAICVEASTMLITPFWWFNNSSAVSVVLLFLSVLACLQQPKLLLPWISLSLSLAMVLASKPNDLPACLMVLVLLATKDRWQWVKTLLVCAGSGGFFLLACYVARMPPLELLRSYMEIGKLRGSPLQMLPIREMSWPESEFQIIFIVLSVLCLVALLGVSARRQPGNWRLFAVCAVAGLTSLEMAFTNSECACLNLSPMLAASAFLFLRPWEAQEISARRKTLLAGCLFAFLGMSVFFAVIHLRILGIGEGLFYEPLPTETIQSGFFSGLEAGPRLQEVLSQTTQVLSLYPAEKVFFGPRMEFEYAVFNRTPMRGMPLLWDPGNMFSPHRLPKLLLTFQQQDPDLLIFLNNDYTRMGPVEFYIRNTNTYRRVDTFKQLTVYVRQKNVPIALVRIPASSTAQY